MVVPVQEEKEEVPNNIDTTLANDYFNQEVIEIFNIGLALDVKDIKFLRGIDPIKWKHDGIC